MFGVNYVTTDEVKKYLKGMTLDKAEVPNKDLIKDVGSTTTYQVELEKILAEFQSLQELPEHITPFYLITKK